MPRNPDPPLTFHEGAAPKAPAGLDRAGVTLWDEVQAKHQIDDGPSLEILRSACECLDRAEAAKAEILRDGMTVTSATGSLRPHPMLPIEAQFRGLMLRHLQSLGINSEARHDRPGRPSKSAYFNPFHKPLGA